VSVLALRMRRNARLGIITVPFLPTISQRDDVCKEAVAEGRANHHCDGFQYTKIAKTHGVTRSTLTRQLNGECASKEDQALKQRLMHPRDEAELVHYIRGLTE
jgi:hypothetical protein